MLCTFLTQLVFSSGLSSTPPKSWWSPDYYETHHGCHGDSCPSGILAGALPSTSPVEAKTDEVTSLPYMITKLYICIYIYIIIYVCMYMEVAICSNTWKQMHAVKYNVHYQEFITENDCWKQTLARKKKRINMCTTLSSYIHVSHILSPVQMYSIPLVKISI